MPENKCLCLCRKRYATSGDGAFKNALSLVQSKTVLQHIRDYLGVCWAEAANVSAEAALSMSDSNVPEL